MAKYIIRFWIFFFSCLLFAWTFFYGIANWNLLGELPSTQQLENPKFYQASEKTLKARKEAYLMAEKQFEAGVLNSFDFIQIKQRYEIASSDNIRAKYDYIFKLKVLEFYFGIEISV